MAFSMTMSNLLTLWILRFYAEPNMSVPGASMIPNPEMETRSRSYFRLTCFNHQMYGHNILLSFCLPVCLVVSDHFRSMPLIEMGLSTNDVIQSCDKREACEEKLWGEHYS